MKSLERSYAKKLGGRRQSQSGAGHFDKHDVRLPGRFLIELKRTKAPSLRVRTNYFLLVDRRARKNGEHAVLVTDFDGQERYAICREETYLEYFSTKKDDQPIEDISTEGGYTVLRSLGLHGRQSVRLYMDSVSARVFRYALIEEALSHPIPDLNDASQS